MTFSIYKALTGLIWPSSVIMLVLVVGALLLLSGKARRLAGRLLIVGVVALVVCGNLPASYLLVLPLEQRFSRPMLPPDATGIIILGGFEVAGVSHARGHLQLNEAAERLTEGVVLARRLSTAKLIFTGGDGSMMQLDGSAATAVGRFFDDMGIDRARVVLEHRSRTTHENAVLLARILKPRAGQRWLLVTSAYHMPRAVGAFRHQGFEVVAWPVDYRSRGWRDVGLSFGAVSDGLARFDLATKEWLGLLAYWALGRSSTLWPGSQQR